jgi:hypothetical protein
MPPSKKKTKSRKYPEVDKFFNDIKKLNSQLKKIHKIDALDDVNYIKHPQVYWEYDQKPTMARGKDAKNIITKKELDVAYLPKTPLNKYIKCECLRFEEYHEYANLGKSAYTIGEFMEKIYIFYNKIKLTKTQLESFPNDSYDYVKNALIKLNKGKNVYRIDLIGDAKFFEGLIMNPVYFAEYIVYDLLTGS